MQSIQEIKSAFYSRAAERKALRQIAARQALSQNSELRRLVMGRNALWAKATKGEIPLGECEEQAAKLEGELQKALKKSGLPANIFEAAPACPKCSDHGYIGKKMCSCLRQYLIETLGYSDAATQLENFSTFDETVYSDVGEAGKASPRMTVARIRAKMEQYIQGFGYSEENFVFFGPAGIGKTFMANCVAFELAAAGYSVVNMTANHMVKLLTDEQFGRIGTEETSPIYEADLLIIDDLGSETLSDISQSALFNVINDRIKDHKKMLIPTNLYPKDIDRHYPQRLVSRLIGHFTWIPFPVGDLRLKAAGATKVK